MDQSESTSGPKTALARSPSSRITFSADQFPPCFVATLQTALHRLDALDDSARQTGDYLSGLKEDFRLLRRQAGQFVREQGENISNLESNVPK
jgi:hypothetical protein